MATETTDVLDAIEEHRRRMLQIREEQDEIMRRETRRLAELLRDARDDPDPKVNPSSAAKRMGVNKNYTHTLIHRLERGELDG